MTGNIQGLAVSPQAEPVGEVRVAVAGPTLLGTRISQTDAQGFFQLLALPPGSYTVRLARIGYRPVVVEDVPVQIGSTTNLGPVTVEPQALELGELVVSAPRFGGPIIRDRLWFSAAYNPQVQTSDRAVPGFTGFEDRLRRHVFAGKLLWQAAAATSVELLLFGDRSTHHKVSASFFAFGVAAVEDPDPYLRFTREGHTSGSARMIRQLGTHGLLEVSLARATSYTQSPGEVAEWLKAAVC